MNKFQTWYQSKSQSQKWTMLGILGLVFGILIVFSLGRAVASQSNISGTLEFSALRPDPNDEGTVTILYRTREGRGAYRSTGVEVPLVDGASWQWSEAKTGETYELMPELKIRGEVVGSAESVVVTAPATNVELNLRVTWSDLPAEIVAGQTANLTGTAAVQGIIPDGARMLVKARLDSSATYQTIQTINNVEITNDWLWTNAVPLETYLVKAVLMDGSTQVGESNEVSAEAGEKEVRLVVVSGAAPTPTPTPPTTPNASPTPTPAPAGTILGTVYINGPKAANSSLLMLFRTPGVGEFREIGRIQNPTHGGQTWRFNATAGVTYEIQAVLQVNEQNSATARSQIVVAPAQNVNFTINTGVTIDTPTALPVLENCSQRSDNRWDATLRFPTIADAGNYWYQAGSNPGARDLYNSKRSATTNQSNQRVTVQIDGNRNYFAQYAFSLCTTCSSDENFSNFSTPFQFSCGAQPTPTPEATWTGYICNQSNRSCELTRDANPPFSFNNAGLEQCQRSCAPTPLPTAAPTAAPEAEAVPLPAQL